MSRDSTISVVTVRVVGGLLTAAILGVGTMALTQVRDSTRLASLETEQNRQKEIVDSVDVMQRDIEAIKQDVADLETQANRRQTELLKAIQANGS